MLHPLDHNDPVYPTKKTGGKGLQNSRTFSRSFKIQRLFKDFFFKDVVRTLKRIFNVKMH